MQYVESPEVGAAGADTIFLAGGITGCPDWQAEARQILGDTDITVFNPRRADFPIGDPDAAYEQIRWEWDHLQKAESILFWFPCETLCPIVLFELGAWSRAYAGSSKAIFVGAHPDYKRRQDVVIQMGFARPRLDIHTSLPSLLDDVRVYHGRGE